MYKPASQATWKGRIDAEDGELGLRWHQAVRLLDLSDAIPRVAPGVVAFALLGFCCDEGVRRNQGRVGAVAGPAALRGAMTSFAWHLPNGVGLYDAGDVLCTGTHLEEAQEQLGKKIALLVEQGYRPLVLGGGHEVAFAHFLGLEQATEACRLGILNVDAHFDLRSYAKQPTSGTPFLQIADRLQAQEREFKYKVLGVQEQSNTLALFRAAAQRHVRYTLATDMLPHRLPHLQQELGKFLEEVDQVYVTLDLDAFGAAYAPGVSAVNPLGLQPQVVLPLLQQMAHSGKLLSMDVAELNPDFDVDQHTAKLGASLIYHMVQAWAQV